MGLLKTALNLQLIALLLKIGSFKPSSLSPFRLVIIGCNISNAYTFNDYHWKMGEIVPYAKEYLFCSYKPMLKEIFLLIIVQDLREEGLLGYMVHHSEGYL